MWNCPLYNGSLPKHDRLIHDSKWSANPLSIYLGLKQDWGLLYVLFVKETWTLCGHHAKRSNSVRFWNHISSRCQRASMNHPVKAVAMFLFPTLSEPVHSKHKNSDSLLNWFFCWVCSKTWLAYPIIPSPNDKCPLSTLSTQIREWVANIRRQFPQQAISTICLLRIV